MQHLLLHALYKKKIKRKNKQNKKSHEKSAMPGMLLNKNLIKYIKKQSREDVLKQVNKI